MKHNKPSPTSSMRLPVGSMASRAAARALLTGRIQNPKNLDFVITCVGCPDVYNPPTVGEWREHPDGTMSRVSRIPWGMTIEEAERMAR